MKSKRTYTRQDNGRAGTLAASLLVVALLLVMPLLALRRQGADLRWVAAYGVVISIITYWVYGHDKRRAQDGGWRIAETRLHLLELLGGWPAAWMAQRRLRHKCSKVSFQIIFWLIVLAYQAAAVDALRDGQLTRAGLNWVEHQIRSRK